MIRVPGERPHVPPPITPKEAKPAEEAKPEAQRPVIPPPKEGARGPEFDAKAIAVRMAALASEAKEKELSFEEIIQRVVEETGMTNPESALEEANRRLQKEIEEVIEQIKSNRDLMEEAEAWEEFAQVLEQFSEETVEKFIGLVKETIKGL